MPLVCTLVELIFQEKSSLRDMRAKLKAFQKPREKVSNHVALKHKYVRLFIVIYLSVAGFTINSFLSPFIKKKKKCIIIGSSVFHNYDSYTVEFTKAASAKRRGHVDRQPKTEDSSENYTFVFPLN